LDVDTIHLFLVVPPKYRTGKVVHIELGRGKLWGDGHFVQSVGDEMTEPVICMYITLINAPHLAERILASHVGIILPWYSVKHN
jgi:hypothetical protein